MWDQRRTKARHPAAEVAPYTGAVVGTALSVQDHRTTYSDGTISSNGSTISVLFYPLLHVTHHPYPRDLLAEIIGRRSAHSHMP